LKKLVLQEFSEKLPLYSVDVPLATRKEYGCNMTHHLHNLTEVMETLNTNYEIRWRERSGMMACPTQSPNLNSLDFFSGVT